MRNPARKRNVAALCVLALAATTLVLFWMRPPVDAHGWQDVVAVFTASFALLAFIGVPIYQLEVTRYQRLSRGADVIARWFVSPADWAQFTTDEPARNSANGAAANIVDLNATTTLHGVEVIIGKESLMVGGDFHSLPRAGISRISGPSWVRGSPACLEFLLMSPGTNDVTSEFTIRFPVAKDSTAAANAVQEHYLKRDPERYIQRDPKRMRTIGLGVTAAGAIALVSGLLAWNSDLNANLLIVLVVTGLLVTPGGMLIAFVWHRQMPRRPQKYPY